MTHTHDLLRSNTMEAVKKNNPLPMIVERMKELGIGDTELGRRAGLSKDIIRKWREGHSKMPSYDRVVAILDALDIGEPVANIPIYGDIPGGVPMVIEEPMMQEKRAVSFRSAPRIIENFPEIEIPRPRPGTFAMRVRGQSMNLVAPEGHYIIVNPNFPPIDELDNKLVVAEVNGECTFKRFGFNPLRLEPMSTDIEYRAQYFKPGEVRIVGVVEIIIRDLRS